MARVYDIAVAALAIGVDRKWLDNLTSQHSIPGTEHVARGVSRRLSLRALVTAAIVRDLNQSLGVPVARAVAVSIELLDHAEGRVVDGDGSGGPPVGSPGAVGGRVSDSIELRVDIGRIERDIEARLLDAMERVVPRRRGRPPLKERRGTR
jgi:hypothetical protein